MEDGAGPLTRLSLLERVRCADNNPAAWEEFVDVYGPKVYAWCRRWGLQEADAQDVTQDVLLALARQMSAFQYDERGSFRAWLKTVAQRAWLHSRAKHQRPGAGTGDSAVLLVLHSLPARDDLLHDIDEEAERERLRRALARVRTRVQPQTWEAFRLLALEGLSGAEVARRLQMQIGTAFMARSNVQKMLREELARLA